MILRRHDPTINGSRLSQFIIIKLDSHSHGFAELVDRIISSLKSQESPEYCLLVGDYASKSRILDTIQDKYHIEWIGEHYCIASRIKKGYAAVPKAAAFIYEHSFSLNLRGMKILCTNTTPSYSDIEDIEDIRLNLLDLYATTKLDDIHIDYEQEAEESIMCISIPFYQIENLSSCL